MPAASAAAELPADDGDADEPDSDGPAVVHGLPMLMVMAPQLTAVAA